MRSLLVLFAVVGVLACPYNCAVRAVSTRAWTKEAKTGCCDLCRVKHDAENQRSSDPTPAQEHRSCVCDGIALESPTRTSIDSLLFSAHWVIANDSALVLDAVMPERTTIDSARPPLFGSGRSMRVSLLSLVI